MAPIDWSSSDRYQRRRLAAGTTLCREGDFGDTMYLVTEGSLQISKRLIEGAEKVIATLGVGQYAGELSLLTGAQRSATMRATVDTEVVEIDQKAFIQLMHDQPQVGLELMQQMARRIHETTEGLILTELEIALAQHRPRRVQPGSQRMRFVATGSFASDKTTEVLRLAAECLSLAHNPVLLTSLMRPGRTKDALIYILETDDPRDLLTLIAPFTGLVQWDISPAMDIDAAFATVPS